MVGESVSASSDRLTDLEQTVESRRTIPVTDANTSHVPLEALTCIEQALMHEIGRVKDENTKSMLRQVDLLERLNQKQKLLEKQLTGLKSFSQQVEKFLTQSASEGATAPTENPHVTRAERERPTTTSGYTPGTSSSSTRPPPYFQAPEPPSIPAPPVPRDVTPPPDDSRASATLLAQCEAKSEQEQFALTSPILNNGQLETQPSCETKKPSKLGILGA